MPLTLIWGEIAVRLALCVVAGALIGIDRSERGRAAGLRTTLLVCLAATVAMIQTNLLLPTAGKTPGSFAVLDLMRLPLGILTGMGFIGAGAIIRRGELVQGVTTAATLWLVTVIGLCLGGGQLGLGLATLGIALVVLWALRRGEALLRQDRGATLVVLLSEGGPTEQEIRGTLLSAGYRVKGWEFITSTRGGVVRRKLRCEVNWRGRPDEVPLPGFVGRLSGSPGVIGVRWKV